MDNGTGITPVMPIGGNGIDSFGGGGFWIFALLILAMMGGNGFGFGNNGLANAIGYENLATSNEVQRGFDNQNLQAQTRDILAAVNAGTAQSVAATNQTFHDSLMANQGLYNEVARDLSNLALGQSNLLANQNECCCSQKMLIQESTAGIQKWIDWERETKETLERFYCELLDLNEISTAMFLKDFIKDVDCELKYAERKQLDLASVDYDMVYILDEQKTIHDEYKSML